MKRPNILFFSPTNTAVDWIPYSTEIFQQYGMEALPLRMPNVRKPMDEGVTFTRASTPSGGSTVGSTSLASSGSPKDVNSVLREALERTNQLISAQHGNK